MNWVRLVARVGFYCFWKVCLWVDFSGIGFSGEDLSFLLSLFLGWCFSGRVCLGVDLSDMGLYGEGLSFY